MSPNVSETPKYNDFREKTSFACNSIETNVWVTSKTILLTDWVDLDSLFVVQPREIARVLGPQGVPAEPDIDTVIASTQGILSDFTCFSLILLFFRKFSNFEALKAKFRMNNIKTNVRGTSGPVFLDD